MATSLTLSLFFHLRLLSFCVQQMAEKLSWSSSPRELRTYRRERVLISIRVYSTLLLQPLLLSKLLDRHRKWPWM